MMLKNLSVSFSSKVPGNGSMKLSIL